MAKQTINLGTTPNDHTGDAARTAFDKVNDNFTEVYDAIDELEESKAASSHTHAISDTTGLQAALDAKAAASDLTSHTGNTSNPHSVTKAQVGLGNCDNTSDANKPVSTAQQTALDLKLDANHASVTNARTPTGSAGGVLSGTFPNPGFAVDMATQAELDAGLATKAAASHTHAQSDITGLVSALSGKEPTQTAASQAEAEAGSGTSVRSWTPQRIAQAIAALGGGGFVTGMEIDYAGLTAPSGWVRKNGGSIGSAGSSATERAHADTADLFALFWDNYADTECPVAGGRGASAAADFADNKALTLPDARGRVSVPVKTGAFGTLGGALGAETHELTEAELPVIAGHTHTQPAHDHDIGDSALVVSTAGDLAVHAVGTTGAGPRSSGGGGDNTGSAGGFGGGGAHNNIQPTLVTGCRLIKL